MATTKPYVVREGCSLNQNGEIRRAGEVIELTESQAADNEIAWLVQPLPVPQKKKE